MMTTSPKFDMKEFIKGFDFSQRSYQDYMQFVCTQGQKENFFSTMLARDLDIFFASNHPRLFAITEQEDNSKKVTSKGKSEREVKVFSLMSLDTRKSKFDVAIYDLQDNLTDIIEFKTNRHKYYVTDKMFRNPQDPSLKIDSYWEKTFIDINICADLKRKDPKRRFWIGTLLYSFQPIRSDLPIGYPQYLGEERESRAKGVSPTTLEELDKECLQNCNAFMTFLLEVKNRIPEYVSIAGKMVKSGNTRKIRLEREDVVCKTVARGEHRGVLVRSDLIFFELQLP